MKSNKEIKNLSTDEESIKRGLKDIKEGRTFNEVQIRAISELLKIKDKEYSQKIKELEKWNVSPSVNDLTDKLIEKENDIERLKHKLLTYSRPIGTSYVDVREEGRKEVNQRWTEKIKELIKHFDFLGSGGDNYAKHVVKRLKSLLGEKDD